MMEGSRANYAIAVDELYLLIVFTHAHNISYIHLLKLSTRNDRIYWLAVEVSDSTGISGMRERVLRPLLKAAILSKRRPGTKIVGSSDYIKRGALVHTSLFLSSKPMSMYRYLFWDVSSIFCKASSFIFSRYSPRFAILHSVLRPKTSLTTVKQQKVAKITV